MGARAGDTGSHQHIGVLSSLGPAGVGHLATGKLSQLPVTSLGWSKENELFLWREKWKRNKMGCPASHFLLSRQWVACLPLPAGVRRLGGVWAGFGAPCWCGVCLVALATTGQWWEVTFSDQRTVYRDQKVETHPSHWNLLPLPGPPQPTVHMGPWIQDLGTQQALEPLPLPRMGCPWDWSSEISASAPPCPSPLAITLLPV